MAEEDIKMTKFNELGSLIKLRKGSEKLISNVVDKKEKLEHQEKRGK
ncbi:hypothetical protein [Pedobacter sp. BMA]|nr:hypothetical protein [Pedobacter sp. BMA]